MNEIRPASLLNAAVFAVSALVVFLAAIALLDRLSARRLSRAVLDDGNVAAAILAGAVAIAVATVVAAAFH